MRHVELVHPLDDHRLDRPNHTGPRISDFLTETQSERYYNDLSASRNSQKRILQQIMATCSNSDMSHFHRDM